MGQTSRNKIPLIEGISVDEIKREFARYDNFGNNRVPTKENRYRGTISNILLDLGYGFIKSKCHDDIFFLSTRC